MFCEFDYSIPLMREIQKSGWRVEEFSYLTRIPEGMVYKFLLGIYKPDPETMRRFSVVLGVQPEKLFSEYKEGE
jgi:hypothetical protein